MSCTSQSLRVLSILFFVSRMKRRRAKDAWLDGLPHVPRECANPRRQGRASRCQWIRGCRGTRSPCRWSTGGWQCHVGNIIVSPCQIAISIDRLSSYISMRSREGVIGQGLQFLSMVELTKCWARAQWRARLRDEGYAGDAGQFACESDARGGRKGSRTLDGNAPRAPKPSQRTTHEASGSYPHKSRSSQKSMASVLEASWMALKCEFESRLGCRYIVEATASQSRLPSMYWEWTGDME